MLQGTPSSSMEMLGSPEMTVRAEKSTRLPMRFPLTRPSFPFSLWLIDLMGLRQGALLLMLLLRTCPDMRMRRSEVRWLSPEMKPTCPHSSPGQRHSIIELCFATSYSIGAAEQETSVPTRQILQEAAPEDRKLGALMSKWCRKAMVRSHMTSTNSSAIGVDDMQRIAVAI